VARDVTEQQTRVLELARLVRKGNGWTTYGTLGAVVYGPGNGAQTVGNTMRDYGKVESAHRILLKGGRVSPHVRGALGSSDEAIRRLTQEGIWDETHNCARKDRFINAAQLRQLGTQ
jgi:alkylated DNA nucleotide flippase Atl1